MSTPTNPPDDDEPDSIVEIDAMDEDEWDKDQHTPTVNNDTLARLVKESVTLSAPEPAPATPVIAPSRKTVTTVAKPRAATSPGIGPASPADSGPTKVPR